MLLCFPGNHYISFACASQRAMPTLRAHTHSCTSSRSTPHRQPFKGVRLVHVRRSALFRSGVTFSQRSETPAFTGTQQQFAVLSRRSPFLRPTSTYQEPLSAPPEEPRLQINIHTHSLRSAHKGKPQHFSSHRPHSIPTLTAPFIQEGAKLSELNCLKKSSLVTRPRTHTSKNAVRVAVCSQVLQL